MCGTGDVFFVQLSSRLLPHCGTTVLFPAPMEMISMNKGYAGMEESHGNAFGGILGVPKNADGMRSLELNVDDSENVMEWELTDSENSSLAGTYYDINDRIGTVIDYCEDEIIPLDGVPGAMGVVLRNLARTEDATLQMALRKLGDALELASECGTCVWVFL